MPVNDPVTPPRHIAEWATDGGADKALPASPSTGHAVGDTSDFNSDMNYILNNLAGWGKFIAEVNAADIAFNQLNEETGENFGASALSAAHMTWDELASLWYFATYRAGVVELYDSATAAPGTWGVAHPLTGTADEKMTPLRSNGTYVGLGIDGGFHLSTDLTVANISDTPTASFLNITDVLDCIYDQDSGRWFVVGTAGAGVNSYMESSADGTTWVDELSFGGSIGMNSISHDNAGGGVLTTDTASVNYYITGGMEGAWSGATIDPGAAIVQTAWAPSLGLFIGTTVGDAIFFSEDGDNWHDTDLNATDVWVNPDFVLMRELSTNECLAFTSVASSRTDYTFSRVGQWSIYASNPWDGDTTWEGGQGKLVFTHDSNDTLAYSHYGPEA